MLPSLPPLPTLYACGPRCMRLAVFSWCTAATRVAMHACMLLCRENQWGQLGTGKADVNGVVTSPRKLLSGAPYGGIVALAAGESHMVVSVTVKRSHLQLLSAAVCSALGQHAPSSCTLTGHAVFMQAMPAPLLQHSRKTYRTAPYGCPRAPCHIYPVFQYTDDAF